MASQNFITLQSIHDRAKQTRIQETEPTHFKNHTSLQERNRGLPEETLSGTLLVVFFNLRFFELKPALENNHH